MSYIKNLIPDEKNVDESYKSDLIGRKALIHDFISMLDEIPGKSAVALSGDWGSGKTFFVKQTKLVLDKNNKLSNASIDSDYKVNIENDYSTLYFDAWLHDNDEEPLASLIAQLTEAAGFGDEEHNKEKFKKAVDMGIAILNLFKPKTAETAVHIIKTAKKADSFFNFDKTALRSEEEKISDKIIGFYDALIPERSNRLIIFIDELDRCRPDFAVRFLERIKHYLLLDERVIFVFSINRGQLEQSIKHFYGYGFDSHRYLDRFFDFIVELDKPDIDKFCAFIDGEMHPAEYDTFSEYFQNLIKYFQMTMRETANYLNIMKRLFNKNMLNEPAAFYVRTQKYVIYIFAPILCAAKITSPEKYNALINGTGSDIIRDIGSSYYYPEFTLLWEKGETPDSSQKDKTFVSLTDKYIELYEAVFMFPADKHSTKIGQFDIRKDTKDFLLSTFNSLGSIR